MSDDHVRAGVLQTARHRTAYLEAGPADGPLMILLHGWPERAVVWRAQLEHFGARGYRCVAPDMRGYGDSSAPDDPGAYALREVVADMLELHDAFGGAPAVWVGHDWGSPVVWSLAAHHADRCAAVASLCVPYLAEGFALPTVLPLVDRAVYPADRFPDGQWSYWRLYLDDFDRAVADFDADPAATVSLLFQRTRGYRAVRSMADGWFGPARRAPQRPRDTSMLTGADFGTIVDGLRATGFRGPCFWYLNDAANMAYAAEAPDGGRLGMPVLFVHAARDAICDTVHTGLGVPMRGFCTDLTEVTVDVGHAMTLESPDGVNAALYRWLSGQTGTD